MMAGADDDLIKRGEARRYYGRLYGLMWGFGGAACGILFTWVMFRTLLTGCVAALF